MGTKILHLLRHGKATWDYDGIDDFDRPLVEKGIHNNVLMARRFSACFSVPELIVTSPAVRAYSTAVRFASLLDYPLDKIQLCSDLYFTDKDAMLSFIYSCPDQLGSLMLVSHNPDITELANSFVRGLTDDIPTSGLVSISFEADDWAHINGNVSSWVFDYPKKK
jgi:phosphohistidine phosphatase